MPYVEHFSVASSGQVRCSCKIALVKAVFVRPLNGRLPKSSSYLTWSAGNPLNANAMTGKLTPEYPMTSNRLVQSTPSLSIPPVLSGQFHRSDNHTMRSLPIYAILPATPVNSLLSEKCTAMLKSVMWACPRSSSKILSGFRSLHVVSTKA